MGFASSTVDDIKKFIKSFIPQGETVDVRSGTELMFWSMFSSFWMIENIALSIYNYLIDTYSLHILYVLAYIILSFYIFHLG